MEPDDRQRLLSDVVEQIEELTLLMNDLIELARGEEPFAASEEVRLDLLVRDVDRARPPPRAERRLRRRARADGRRRRPRAAGARARQPDRQRDQVQPAGTSRSRSRSTAES